MTTPENPFDQTIWDPIDPEHAIEDPFHGPSATLGMLAIPPMPYGNGYYRRFGGFPFGTGTEDALGNSVIVIGRASSMSMSQMHRDLLTEREWIDAANEGQEALIELEAARQRSRLEQTGVAHAFKPTDVCAGGQQLQNCDTAQEMIAATETFESIGMERDTGSTVNRETPLWLGKTCMACTFECSISVQVQDGRKTGITRFTNTAPDLSMHRLKINLSQHTAPTEV